MNAGYKKTLSKFLAAVLSMLMVFGNIGSPVSGVFNAYATDDEQSVEAVAETTDEAAADDTETEVTEENADTEEASDAAAAEEQTESSATDDANTTSEDAVADTDEDASEDASLTDDEAAQTEDSENQDSGSADSVFSGEVYVNGESGNDENDGLTANTAVKTWDRVVEIIEDNPGTIYVSGVVTASGEISTKYPQVAQVVKRAAGYTRVMFDVDGEATFKNIHIDGEKKRAYTAAITMGPPHIGEGVAAETLKIGENAVFEGLYHDDDLLDPSQDEFAKNYNNDPYCWGYGGVIQIGCTHAKAHGSKLIINGGEFYDNIAGDAGGVIYAAGDVETTIYSGIFENNKANKASVYANYTSSPNNHVVIYNALITENKSTGTAAHARNYDRAIWGDGAIKGSGTTSPGAISVCTASNAEVTVSSSVSDGAAIYNNTGTGSGDIGVWREELIDTLKVNEGSMLGGGNHNWSLTESGMGYISDPSAADIQKAIASATTIVRNNESFFQGAIQSNGVITLGSTQADLRIRKVDSETENVLSGVEFKLTGTTNGGVAVNRTAKTKAKGDPYETEATSPIGVVSFTDIAPGEYTLKETAALEGYVKPATEWKVVVDTKGNLTLSDENGIIEPVDNDFYNYVIENEKTNIKISKTDLNGTEIEGAEIVVKDADGNVVDSWTSGSEPHKISGITAGDYTMTEVVAPEGYECVKTEISFHVDVDADGNAAVTTTAVTENGNVVNEVDKNGVLVLKDAPYIKPEVEKYVNKDVTWDFDNFDQVFEYEIMAYVPYDATGFTISDVLVSALEFANGGNVQLFDMGEGYDVNDHNVNGTVAKAGTAIDATSANASNKHLEVVLEGEKVEAVRRHWIKVTFEAQITEAARQAVMDRLAEKASSTDNTAATVDGEWENIDDNLRVLVDTDHDGVPNKANYAWETSNNGSSDMDTNTVTVEPKTVDLKVKKSWKNVLWPTNTKVTFGVYKHKSGASDKEVAKIVLDSNETQKTITLPMLEGVTYSAKEINVNKNGVDSTVNVSGNFVIGAINYIANIVKDLFAGSTDGDHETQNELKVEVKINKTDLGGNELDGAEIVVYDKNGNKVKNWISKKGETFDLLLEPGDYTFEEVVAPAGYHKVTTKIGFTVDEDGKVTVNTTTVDPLGAVKLDANNTIVLSDAPIQKPEDEKYVNNDVTADLDNFDDTFEYEIMAYVTNDGTALTITDELVPALEFVGDGNVKVYDMGTENDHATTVAKKGNVLGENAYTAETEGQNLTVKVDDAKPYREHWIKVTFDAQISQKAYDEVAALIAEKTESGTAKDADNWANVKNNLRVLINKVHDGVPNKAKYTLETINRGDFTEETNTVTVEPKTTEVKVSKVWQKDDKNIEWPEGATVQVKLQSQKGSEAAEDVAGAVATLTKNEQSHVFKDLPMLDGVKYSVVEVKAANADEFTLGSAVETKAGEWTITNKTYTPEIEKFVNEAVHKDVDLNEVFKYDVVAYVTPDADKVVIKDELNDDLQFVSKADDVKVTDLGKANNHDVTNNIEAKKVNDNATVAEEGTAIDAEVSIEGNLLKVVIEDAKEYRGNWVRVAFEAKIADGKKLADLKYTEINVGDEENRAEPNVGNAPVNSDEDHAGIPNKASYDIYVSNNASMGTGSGDKPRYEDESNTVTVKPEEYTVKISKTDLGGTEIPGAEIKVTGSAGFEETWTSTDEAKELKLVAGEYTMVEVVAPKGYQQVTTEIAFTVDEDGNVTLKTTEVNGGGKVSCEDNHIVLKDAPEKPAIEKYVNKKTDNLADEERDGTVHTDLSAFDEVYTYDIQAYITADATVVEVTDELKSVLEFAGDAPTSVVVKDGEGASGAVAPKLTKAGEAPAYEYSVDAEAWKAGKLVLTMGSDAKDAKALYPNGKWLQITFDAKIKDSYKSIEALKAAGADVWETIKVNEEIDDADVVNAFSGAKVDAHEGIVNDSSYRIKSIVKDLNVNVDNEWAYGVKSNTVTVQPKSTEVSFSKKELGGEELPGAEMVLTDSEGNVIDTWTSTTEDHVLHLADGVYTMTEKVAPEGFYCVTTAMKFEVKDGKVTLLTAEVDNGGRLTLMEGNKIVLEDAPEVQEEYEPPKDDDEEEGSIVTPGGDESESTVKEAYEPEVRDVYVKEVADEETVRIVDTGDNAAVYIWALVFMISMCAVALAAIMRRRSAR